MAKVQTKTNYSFGASNNPYYKHEKDAESLTYSIGSGTGESTDSSFGDFLRNVLKDDDDSKILREVCQEETIVLPSGLVHSKNGNKDSAAVKSKKNVKVGQVTDSRLYDGGGLGSKQQQHEGIIFAAAEQPHKSSSSKRQQQQQRRQQHSGSTTIASTNSSNSSSTPPRPDKLLSNSAGVAGNNNEVWYSQWWMCGFGDIFNTN